MHASCTTQTMAGVGGYKRGILYLPIVLLFFVAALGICTDAAADEPFDGTIFDSLNVLISGTSGDESTAIPLFLSDIEFEARLLLIKKHGADWQNKSIDTALFFIARRKTTLVAVLAYAALLIGEEASQIQSAAIVKEITNMAGGETAVDRLLSACGMNRNDLHNWANRTVLARLQLKYLAERIEPPTEKELLELYNRQDPLKKELPFAQIKDRFRKEIMDKRLVQAIGQWLQGILEHGQIRYIA